MIVSQSVRHAIDDWEQRKLESAMLHACNAVPKVTDRPQPNRQVLSLSLRRSRRFCISSICRLRSWISSLLPPCCE